MITDLNHIPPKRRELFLRVWNGHTPVHDVTARLFYLDTHFPEAGLDDALRWLVRNQLVGRSFVQFVEADCGGSNLELHRRLISKLEHEKKLRKIYAGKDFRT